MSSEIKHLSNDHDNSLEYEMVLLKTLFEPQYKGPSKIVCLEQAAAICGLNFKNQYDKSRIRRIFHRVLCDMFTPVIVKGLFTDSWEFNPARLHFVDIRDIDSCASDFYRCHPNGQTYKNLNHQPLTIDPQYKCVYQQKVINGKTVYKRIYI